MDVRRVVTGHDAQGKAVFVSDERVAPYVPAFSPHSAFHMLWRFDDTPEFPDDGSEPPVTTYFPRVGGFRFNFFTLPPDGDNTVPEGVDIGDTLAEFRAALPGMLDVIEPDNPGMHTTSTLDVEVVLSGTPVLELDDGAKVTLGVATPWCRTARGTAGRTPAPNPPRSRSFWSARTTPTWPRTELSSYEPVDEFASVVEADGALGAAVHGLAGQVLVGRVEIRLRDLAVALVVAVDEVGGQDVAAPVAGARVRVDAQPHVA